MDIIVSPCSQKESMVAKYFFSGSWSPSEALMVDTKKVGRGPWYLLEILAKRADVLDC